jgi:hypothetical protein
MLYCETCRVKNHLKRPVIYPYHKTYQTKCEICRKHETCYEQPAIYAKDKKTWTFEEKQLDKIFQHEYHQKAENLIIAFQSGRFAGALDQQRSEMLKKTIVRINKQIDWYATFELRESIRDGFNRTKQ